jgi:hypothetical protein
MDVGHCCHPLLVFEDHDVLGDLILYDPLIDELIGMIGGSIINDNYLDVFVVQVYHRLQVILVSEAFCIVESWNHNAKREFRQIEVILLRESIVLFV